jgi:hypothetical protein
MKSADVGRSYSRARAAEDCGIRSDAPIKASEVQMIVNRLRSGGADYLPIGYAHAAADMIERLYALTEKKGNPRVVTYWQGSGMPFSAPKESHDET